MKSALVLSLMMIAAGVSANAMADAGQHAVGQSDSDAQALSGYARLAAEGNAEAQFRLGEMYRYGRGVPVDMAKGDILFQQAEQGGSASARSALTMTSRR